MLNMVFYDQVVSPLEAKLLKLPLGALFSGILYDQNGDPVLAIRLPDLGHGGLQLGAADLGRLFMAPDGSIVSVLYRREQDDGTPAGLNVVSSNSFIELGEKIMVVAYAGQNGSALRLKGLFLHRVMWAIDAPERLGTIAFALQACTAFRFGFAEITLFAGGRGYAGVTLSKDDLIGYQVWPKFGFDAPLLPADLNHDVRFSKCRSVQDVVALDSTWWANNGRGIGMKFDLWPESRSWKILLNYIYGVYPSEDLP
jgi:hypothetical protein